MLVGIIVLMGGGLVGLYLKEQTNEVFRFGVGGVAVILSICFRLMARIENHLKELGETSIGALKVG
uniref:Uncharacterized protein n=1 Tax=Candidatus Kentrum sp. TC TaxID=2126339 RepID=A0A450ZBZ0_9GAMM|nr:MAG: hypothetical protein BECKTC1821E_GA0114239_1001139 [Candidatus Kentron sp. TC]VFK51315.1 MAG: hypothetical protein BECKTC1821F_GA0114240_100142 [Candidatus Kentron sp. TC]